MALPLPFSQDRQPALLQHTMRLNKEPGKMVEGVRHVLQELLAGGGKLSDLIFHLYKMKDNTLFFWSCLQEKNNKTSPKCLDEKRASESWRREASKSAKL